MGSPIRPPTLDCADIEPTDLRFIGRFVRDSLAIHGSAAVAYPAKGAPITVTFMAASQCPITLLAPVNFEDEIIVSPLGYRARTFTIEDLPTLPENAARAFDCNIHTAADLANLMWAVQDQGE